MGQKAGAIVLGAPLKKSSRVIGNKDRLIALAMKGLTGPIDGKNYGVMMPLESNSDQYFAEVLSYIRASWGNKGDLVTAAEVKEVRESIRSQKVMYTMETLYDAYPDTLKSKNKWKFIASTKKSNFKALNDNKIDKKRWSTNESQKAGQTLTIVLDKANYVNGLIMNHGKSKNDYAPRYQVETSLDGENWQKAGEFSGSQFISKARFNHTMAKFIKLTLVKSKGGFWSIHELDITVKQKDLMKNITAL
jgi:hypothetical protein